MTLRLDVPAADGRPATTFEFEKRTVVLGANGVGKSRLLRRIVDVVTDPPRRVVRVEGGRAVMPVASMRSGPPPHGDFSTLESATQAYNAIRSGPLAQRIQASFLLMWRQSHFQARVHSDAVEAYRAAGAHGPVPARDPSLLDLVFRSFMELFPDISIELDPKSESIVCTKNGTPYAPTSLSDGEKQCLVLLADVFALAPNDAVVIVDEPELNLHPSLACSFWDIVEARKPDAIFIYATHCLAFALRESVTKVIVLDRAGVPSVQIGEINPQDLARREFLGAIPSILSATVAIGVEGKDTSIDPALYAWLLRGERVVVVPLGACEDVIAAVTRVDIWRALARDVRLVGVVDRDFKSDAWIAAQPSDRVVLLDLHEAESYLCLPAVVVALSLALGLQAPGLAEADIERAIRTRYQSEWLRIAVKRTNARLGIRLGVGLAREDMVGHVTEAALKTLFEKAASQELAKAQACLSPEASGRALSEEISRCKAVFATDDVTHMLRLLPGKELLPSLAAMAGCKNSAQYVLGVTKHLNADQFEPLKALADALKVRLTP